MTEDSVRIDKWLWAARFFKTRQLALQAIKNGRVLINKQKIKPSRLVHMGDKVTVPQGFLTKEVTVLQLSAQRECALKAQALYEETLASIAEREQALAQRQEKRLARASTPRPMGRPDKHDRKRLKDAKRQL